MTDDASWVPNWEARITEARVKLGRAETDPQRAEAYIEECHAHVDRERWTIHRDPPSVRAARVARGLLSQESALRDALAVSAVDEAALSALIPEISCDLLLRVPRSNFVSFGLAERRMLARLVGDRRIADAFRFARDGRLDEVPYPLLVAHVGERELDGARRALDQRIANDLYTPPVAGGDAGYQRLYALQRLVTRTRLAPLPERAPWFERCERALDANAALIAGLVVGGDVRAQLVLALVEAGESQRALEQFSRVSINGYGFADNDGADATIPLRAALSSSRLRSSRASISPRPPRGPGSR